MNTNLQEFLSAPCECQATIEETVTTMTNTLTEGTLIGTYTNEDGVEVDIFAPTGGTGGGVEGVTGNLVDNTDQLNPVINSDKAGSYDNTASGLTATSLQGAIDEVDANVDALDNRIDALENSSLCDLDAITQTQADTLGLEDLKVVVCGTGDANIDGKTVTLDKVSALFGAIASKPIMGGEGTTQVSNITSTKADLVGTYISDGGNSVTESGFVVYPNGNSSTVIGGLGVMQFIDSSISNNISSTATGLNTNTNYCFKPYAINDIGTTYGEELCFDTLGNIFIAGRQFGLGVSKYNFDTNTILSTLYSGNDIIGLGNEGSIGYASYANNVVKFNTDTMTAISSYTGTFNPNDLKIYDGYIYHCTDSTNILQKIDTSTMTLTSSLTGFGGSAVINCLKVGGFLYVGSKGDARLTKIDLSTFTVVSTIVLETGANNTCIGLSESGGFLYVNVGETNTIHKVDLSSFTAVGSLSAPSYTFYSKVVGGFLYATSLSSGQIRKIDLSTFTVSSVLNIGTNAAGITYDNNGKLFVSLLGTPSGGKVSAIDLSTFTVSSSGNALTGCRNIFIS